MDVQSLRAFVQLYCYSQNDVHPRLWKSSRMESRPQSNVARVYTTALPRLSLLSNTTRYTACTRDHLSCNYAPPWPYRLNCDRQINGFTNPKLPTTQSPYNRRRRTRTPSCRARNSRLQGHSVLLWTEDTRSTPTA